MSEILKQLPHCDILNVVNLTKTKIKIFASMVARGQQWGSEGEGG